MKMLTFLRGMLAGAAALALLNSTPSGHAATTPAPDPGDPLNGTWRISLDDFFVGKKRATPRRPLPIYVISREGKFRHALGSAPDYNQTTYPTDITGLRYDAASGKLAGSMRVKLNPDPWIPKDRKPAMCAVEIEAVLDRTNPTNQSALRGTYRGTFDTETVAGTVSGYVYTQTLVELAQCQLVLLLNHALLGGPEPYLNRIAVRFDVINRQAIAAEFGLVGLDNRPYDFRPFERFSMATTREGFASEFTIPYEVLGALGDSSANYTFKLEGQRINNLCGGEFTVQVAHAGTTTAHEGNFKGSILPAVRLEAPPRKTTAKSDRPWFVPLKDFTLPAADEHPRLFFRKRDLLELKRRAQTPEGQAIVARLKCLLGGGDTLPQTRIKAHHGRTEMDGWTLYHAMGYGFLHHLTGDPKYIALCKQAMEVAYRGQLDEQAMAYSFAKPESYLRGGPSLAAVAMAYDLCFDLWDPAYRQKLAHDLLHYDVQSGAYRITMAQMVQGGNHGPESNHHGSTLGGAGLCLLAIRGDTGVDATLVESFLRTVEHRIERLFQGGMGDTGWFWEGPGPGQIASDTSFIPMLQAFRVAAGQDYAAGRPGAKALMERWIAWLLPRPETKQPIYANSDTSWSMGGYGGRTFGRYGLSRGGQFSQGFGLLTNPAEKAAALWVYKNYVEPSEQADYREYSLNGKPSYDAISLPHRAVLALVNWPIGISPRNPEGIIPKTRGDQSRMGYCYFRNGWKDQNDIFVGVQTGSRPLQRGAAKAEDVAVWGLGERHAFGPIPRTGAPDFYEGYVDGSGLVTSGDVAVAVDYSRAAGANAVIVVCGPPAANYRLTGNGQGRSKFTPGTLAGKACGVLVLSASGSFPEPRLEADQIHIGGQTVQFKGRNLRLAYTAAPSR